MTTIDALAPFAGLTPDTVLDAVEALGFVCDGRTLALSSYENRVYQVGLEDGRWMVAKFYRPGRWSDEAVNEEHAFALELHAHDIPVVAPLQRDGATLHWHQGFRYALFPRQGGHWPELQDDEQRAMMGRFIGRIHAVGRSGQFSHRPSISVERLGHASRDYLLSSDWIPSHLADNYAATSQHLVEAVETVFAQCGDYRELRIHGDCHLGNTLWTDDGPHFVDLDDCLTGPAVQDLWMLLSGEPDEQRQQLDAVLEGYSVFSTLEYREVRLIEPLRALRMLHYTAWVARRWTDPAFPRAFPWLGENRHWEQHVLDLKEQLARVQQS